MKDVANNFTKQLARYKNDIDEIINQYSLSLQQETLKQYGENSRLAVDAFCEILQRGGKRVRGSLVMHSYHASGGKNREEALEVALAVEMMHAYILIIDDIQDRSATRRDGPTAHKILESYHDAQELAGDSKHFGLSIALNAALIGAHASNSKLAKLDTRDTAKSRILSLVNDTMIITAHGQSSDILNEVVAEVTEDDVDRVLEWKTARYTILNPLQTGMALAGKSPDECKRAEAFALQAGRVFQITDDILGTFGSEFESGKSPMDDTREGKRTTLTVHALKNSDNGNKNFLLDKLGDENISPAEFERFKQILVESGALDYARTQAIEAAKLAKASLKPLEDLWPKESVEFLSQLVDTLIDRKS